MQLQRREQFMYINAEKCPHRQRVNFAASFSYTLAFVAADACAHIIRIIILVVIIVVVIVIVVVVNVADGRRCLSSPRSRYLLAAPPGPARSTLEPCLELGSLFVLAIAPRARTDANLDRLTSKHDAGVFQREDDLDRTARQSTDA